MLKRLQPLGKLGYLMAFACLAAISCVKDDNGPDDDKPLSKQEVEQGIVGKWDVIGIQQISSVEFAADGFFVLKGDLSAILGAIPMASQPPRDIVKVQEIAPANGSVAPRAPYTGRYAVSAAGDVVLEEAITLKITKLGDDGLEFEIVIPGGATLKGRATLADALTQADRTRLLARNWKYAGPANPIFTDFAVRFTQFGTAIIRMTVYVEDCSVGPDGKQDCETSTEAVAYAVDWDWKANTANNIVEAFMPDPETGQVHTVAWPISQLSETELAIQLEFDGKPFPIALRAAD